jgi:hypothetical protein
LARHRGDDVFLGGTVALSLERPYRFSQNDVGDQNRLAAIEERIGAFGLAGVVGEQSAQHDIRIDGDHEARPFRAER